MGNNRILADASGTVIQSNQYYPFGMAFAESTTAEQSSQPYKYNGKELDDTHGLNWYDYSARFYDLGYITTPTMDPLSEKFYNWSPYVYCYNNPMKFIDLDGRQGVLTVPRAAYRTYQVSKLLRYGAVGGGVIAGGAYLSNQEVAKRAEEVGNNLIGAAGITTAATKEAADASGWNHQRKNDRAAKEGLDAAQAAVAKGITDHITGDMPSGDPAPKGNIGKIVLGMGTGGAAIKETVEYILDTVNKDSNKKIEDKVKQNPPPKKRHK